MRPRNHTVYVPRAQNQTMVEDSMPDAPTHEWRKCAARVERAEAQVAHWWHGGIAKADTCARFDIEQT
jgi:hypothetical protein